MRSIRNFVSFMFVFLVLTISASAQTTIPPCQLGTAWAVDPHRQLADGEEIYQLPEARVVTISQREKPGSSHIIFRRCTLPKGTNIVRNGATEWAKPCGNTILAEGEALAMALRGEIGPQGFTGPEGPRGRKGDPGQNLVPPQPLCGRSWSSGRRWGCTAVAVLIGGGITAALSGGEEKKKGPGGITGGNF